MKTIREVLTVAFEKKQAVVDVRITDMDSSVGSTSSSLPGCHWPRYIALLYNAIKQYQEGNREKEAVIYYYGRAWKTKHTLV